MEDHIVLPGELEIRQEGGARVLRGRFVYGDVAVMSDRARTRKESFARGSLRFAIDDPARKIDVLVGHNWDKPIANRQSGTLQIDDIGDSVVFEAMLAHTGANAVMGGGR